MSAVRKLNPAGMAFPGMSQGAQAGDFILVSGQVALKDGKPVGIGDPAEQARQCFANIEAILGEAGAKLSDIVHLRCFLVGQDSYAGYAAVKSALFKDIAPCSTGVIVAGLLIPGLVMEVEAVAWKPA